MNDEVKWPLTEWRIEQPRRLAHHTVYLRRLFHISIYMLGCRLDRPTMHLVGHIREHNTIRQARIVYS